MADLSDLSLEQLQKRLAGLETEWYEIEAAIAARTEEDKKQLAKEIKRKIKGAGHDVEEVVGLITARRRRGKAAATSSYTRYVDPDDPNNTYVRGVLPRWLKDKMQATGFDPDDKEHRETFKAQHLNKVAV